MAQAALNSGAQGYVLKTDAGSELLPAIEAVLQGKQYVSRGLAGSTQTNRSLVLVNWLQLLLRHGKSREATV
jgi:DNA-binding NarL/FixJ family response regulator